MICQIYQNRLYKKWITSFRFRPEFLAVFFLILLTVIGYRDLQTHSFLSIDDGVYVTDNLFVRMGLTLSSIKWAFTTLHAEFWHPLTWISLMADTSVYGVAPSGYLSTNLILHLMNSVILYALFLKMTGYLWRSFFVAALFAVHPLHVESVAWISERKDLLSTFFSLLSMYAYICYSEKNNIGTYGMVILFFIMGLMAKPTLVTLPFLFILLDYWPLRRISLPFRKTGRQRRQVDIRHEAFSQWRCLSEKIPLFILSFIFSLLTFIAQSKGNGIVSLSTFSLYDRVLNAILCYGTYIEKMLWPQHLGVFYPVRELIPLSKIFFSSALMTALITLSVVLVQSRPFLAVGIFWFMGTLVPMIGFIKIGDFAMADRFTYFSLIGVFIPVVWLCSEITFTFSRFGPIIKSSTVILLLLLTHATYRQTIHWRDSFSLFTHTLSVTGDNHFCNYGLALLYAGRGDIENATFHFRESVRIKPNQLKYRSELGRILLVSGRFSEAIPHLMAGYVLNPDNEENIFYLAIAMHAIRKDREALIFFERLLYILKLSIKTESKESIAYHLKMISQCSDHECMGKIFMILHIGTDDESLKHMAYMGYKNWKYLKE